MCMSTPDIPEPEDPSLYENELLIGDEEQDQRHAKSKRRGTQGLQIGLNSGGSTGSSLSI